LLATFDVGCSRPQGFKYIGIDSISVSVSDISTAISNELELLVFMVLTHPQPHP